MSPTALPCPSCRRPLRLPRGGRPFRCPACGCPLAPPAPYESGSPAQGFGSLPEDYTPPESAGGLALGILACCLAPAACAGFWWQAGAVGIVLGLSSVFLCRNKVPGILGTLASALGGFGWWAFYLLVAG